MIICGDDHERCLLHCGYVHSFVERAGLHPAFPDTREADEVFLAFKSLRHQSAHSDRNHCPEMADHCEFVVARMTSMNVAITATHRTLPRAQICARHINQRFAECRSSCLVANQWREDVAFLQQ